MKKIKSILNKVVYLYIQTTENSANYILKGIKISNEITSEIELQLNKEDRKKTIKDIENFASGFPLIINEVELWNDWLQGDYINNSEVLNLKELAAILEPWRRYYNVMALENQLTNCCDNSIKNKTYSMIAVTNTLLCRQWQREESFINKESIYKTVNKLFDKDKMWKWAKYIVRPMMFSYSDYPYVLFEEKKVNKFIITKKKIKYEDYEKLLRENYIWNDDGRSNYQYREDQEQISKYIYNNIEKEKRLFVEAPTGSGKTFAYVLIAAIKTYMDKKMKSRENNTFIISTNTKELQNQLIEKDIPMILEKLKLKGKVSYGAMKGKGNYICFDRLNKYTQLLDTYDSRLTYLFLRRLGENGEYGDLESIDYWAFNYFNIGEYLPKINCDSESCNLDKCKKPCFLRNRYNELPTEDITVINHSLLASWPYGEKKKIQHLIIDEAHNLMEKGYDFFTEEFNSLDFLELLKKLDSENPTLTFLLDRLNGLYNYRVNVDKNDLIKKRNDIQFNIIMMLKEISLKGVKSSKYNLSEEFFNAEPLNRELMEGLQGKIVDIKNSIYYLFRALNNYVEEIICDEKEEGNEYKVISNYIMKLKSGYEILDNFITFSKDYAKSIEIHKEYQYFILKNTPLEIGELINEFILKDVKSTTFLSATLKINNSFNEVKNILGQEEADTFYIPPVFNLQERTRIFTVKGLGSYKDEEAFIKKCSEMIKEISMKLDGHILVLFNNNKRRDEMYEVLNKLGKLNGVEVYTTKKAIPLLKEKNRKIIILGSKGFFEGIDIPGDGLSCVIIDKIPNINPKEPLFKALKEYRNKYYKEYNYPKVCIRMKQSYGRLVRSKLDYGYFIILDSGENQGTIKQLERDLNGPKIEEKWNKEIVDSIDSDYVKWKKENLKSLLLDIDKVKINTEFNLKSQAMHCFWELKTSSENNKEYTFVNNNLSIKLNLK